MLARVSNIEAFRRWELNEDATPADLIYQLTEWDGNEATRAGTAFHKALELSRVGDDASELCVDGYRFVFREDCQLELPDIREHRASKDYGPLRVSGKLDAISGRVIMDHKTTQRFNPEGYLAGCQWRFYLDIFDADLFRWNVFVIQQDRSDPMTYRVNPPQLLEQSRYPGLHDDCVVLARRFHECMSRLMPEYQARVEEAA